MHPDWTKVFERPETSDFRSIRTSKVQIMNVVLIFRSYREYTMTPCNGKGHLGSWQALGQGHWIWPEVNCTRMCKTIVSTVKQFSSWFWQFNSRFPNFPGWRTKIEEDLHSVSFEVLQNLIFWAKRKSQNCRCLHRFGGELTTCNIKLTILILQLYHSICIIQESCQICWSTYKDPFLIQNNEQFASRL